MAAVVVSYNYEAYLGRAIDSLLEQEVPFAEVVVVDDGSTDGSLDIARSRGGRVRVVAKTNGGQLSACRAGLDVVSSDYVYFLDADDVALPHLVRAVTPALRGGPVKAQFQLRSVDEHERPTGSVFPTYADGYDAARMRADDEVAGLHLTPPTSANVYRRQTLLDLDWEGLDLRDFVDGPVTFAMPYLGEVAVLGEPLALYRIHGANHSQWFAATPEQLRHETAWFEDRWRQACRLLGREQPPYAAQRPVYALERDLLAGALDGKRWLGPEAVRYARRLRKTHAPRSNVLALQVWALALVVPSGRWRRRLVQQRRAAGGRPWLVRVLVRLVRSVTR